MNLRIVWAAADRVGQISQFSRMRGCRSTLPRGALVENGCAGGHRAEHGFDERNRTRALECDSKTGAHHSATNDGDIDISLMRPNTRRSRPRAFLQRTVNTVCRARRVTKTRRHRCAHADGPKFLGVRGAVGCRCRARTMGCSAIHNPERAIAAHFVVADIVTSMPNHAG